MPDPNPSSLLSKLSEIFRLEGDTETADALLQPRYATPTRDLTWDDVERIREARRKGLHWEHRGRHDKAEPYLQQALAIASAVFGSDSYIIAEHLGELARCRLSAGRHDAALHDYERLWRMTEQTLGLDDERTVEVGKALARCRKYRRDVRSSNQLQRHMTRMLDSAREQRALDAASRLERMRRLADRLKARGRAETAVRLYARWIADRMADAQPDDALLLADLRHLGLSLQQLGHWARAAGVHRALVAMHNKRMARVDNVAALSRALRDWQTCLGHLGATRSAAEIAALADAIDLGQHHGC